MERCPCCNARLRNPSQCQRCHSDLSLAATATESANHFLMQGIAHWQAGAIAQSLLALHQSIRLKDSSVGQVLFNRLLQDYWQQILDLLRENQTLKAKQALYSIRPLISHSPLLSALNECVDFRLIYPKIEEKPQKNQDK